MYLPWLSSSSFGDSSRTFAAASGARCDVLVADLDLGDAEFAGLALVGVADRAVAGGDRFDDAGGALRRPRRP